tara:strand:- start:310 stop:789 length:480 start_codon:yes stop_codon:yes gene_type:complete
MSEHDNFDHKPEDRWRFVTDQVMGGVSTGRLRFDIFREQPIAHMIGDVSTANNGGFIQFRRKINAPQSSSGIKIRVRGNGEKYFIHLRTSGTILPWQYYQASFEASQEWRTIRIPFSEFSGSSDWLDKLFYPSLIRSLGIVAYGRDHHADIMVSQAGFY